MQYKLKFPIFSAVHKSLFKFEYKVQYYEGFVDETAIINFLSFLNSSQLPITVASNAIKKTSTMESIDSLIENFSNDNDSDDFKNIIKLFRSKITKEHMGIFSSMLSYTQPLTFELDSVNIDSLTDKLNQLLQYVGSSLSFSSDLNELVIFSIIQYAMLILNYYNLLTHTTFDLEQYKESPGVYALLANKTAILDHLFFMLFIVGITDTINTKYWVDGYGNKTIRIVKSLLFSCPAYKNVIASPKQVDKHEYDKLVAFIENNDLEQYNLLPTIIYDGLSQEKRVKELLNLFQNMSCMHCILEDLTGQLSQIQKINPNGEYLPFLYPKDLLYNENIAKKVSEISSKISEINI